MNIIVQYKSEKIYISYYVNWIIAWNKPSDYKSVRYWCNYTVYVQRKKLFLLFLYKLHKLVHVYE
jgi:hypothetical protein